VRGAVVVEELGFEQGKTREKHERSKTFRALISGFPTAAFRTRLVAMAYRQGVTVIAVDPRYPPRPEAETGSTSWPATRPPPQPPEASPRSSRPGTQVPLSRSAGVDLRTA
jgi:IS605 OrfB family transposase